MKLSQKGLNLIKESEGLRLKAYDDLQPNKNITGESQVKGTLTIGYGHTSGVKIGQTITKERAEQLLMSDTGWAQETVNQMVKVPLNQSQFDALTSFVYNVGTTNFRTSTLLEYLNKGEYGLASLEFFRWNKSGGKVLQGLVNRRKKEQALFNSEAIVKNEEKKISDIKVLGKIIVDDVQNFTYIYEKTNDGSKRLGEAKKNAQYDIAGSVTGWWEIIYKGKRAYIKSKYARRIK